MLVVLSCHGYLLDTKLRDLTILPAGSRFLTREAYLFEEFGSLTRCAKRKEKCRARLEDGCNCSCHNSFRVYLFRDRVKVFIEKSFNILLSSWRCL